MVYTSPTKTYQFQLFLKFGVDAKGFTNFAMDEGNPDLCAIVMLPKILT